MKIRNVSTGKGKWYIRNNRTGETFGWYATKSQALLVCGICPHLSVHQS